MIGELVATPNSVLLSQVVLAPFLGLLAGPALAGGSCGPPIPNDAALKMRCRMPLAHPGGTEALA